MNDFVSSPNKELLFKQNKTTNEYESEVLIKNISDNFVITKIYSNTYDDFVIKPSILICKPKEEKSFKIIRNNKNNLEYDKIQSLSFKVDKEINSKEEAKEIYKNKSQNERSSCQIIKYNAIYENHVSKSKKIDDQKDISTLSSNSTNYTEKGIHKEIKNAIKDFYNTKDVSNRNFSIKVGILILAISIVLPGIFLLIKNKLL